MIFFLLSYNLYILGSLNFILKKKNPHKIQKFNFNITTKKKKILFKK